MDFSISFRKAFSINFICPLSARFFYSEALWQHGSRPIYDENFSGIWQLFTYFGTNGTHTKRSERANSIGTNKKTIYPNVIHSFRSIVLSFACCRCIYAWLCVCVCACVCARMQRQYNFSRATCSFANNMSTYASTALAAAGAVSLETE